MTDVQNVPDKQVYQGVVQFLVQVSVFMPVRPAFFASPVLSAVRVAEVAGLPVRLALEKPAVQKLRKPFVLAVIVQKRIFLFAKSCSFFIVHGIFTVCNLPASENYL